MTSQTRTFPLLMVAVLTALALAGCTGGKGPSVAAPEWESGHAWSYSWQVSGLSRSGGSDGQDNFTYDDGGTLRAEVVNTTLEVDGVGIYLLAALFDEQPFLSAIRRADLTDLDLDYNLDLRDCSESSCTLSQRDLRLSHPEDAEPLLKFPLREGKTWETRNTTHFEGLEVNMLSRATVGKQETVSTGLGDVKAVRVDVVRQITNLAAIERDLKEQAGLAGLRIDELDIGFGSHEMMHYSSEYRNIVRDEITVFTSFYARGEFEGVPFEEWEDDQEVYTVQLEGARLVPRPERTVAEAVDYLTGELSVTDPTGLAVEATTYSLDLVDDEKQINAATGEMAEFRVELDGVDELPAGHTIEWTLRHASGAEVDNGTGMRFSSSPSQPGLYLVEAEAFDGNGNSLSADGGQLVAHWVLSLEDGCSQASAEVPIFTFLEVGGCAVHDLPVHGGVNQLRITATPVGGNLPSQGHLDVADSVGNTVRGELTGQSAQILIEDFDGFRVDDVPWTMEWQQPLAVEEDVQFVIEILYGSATSPPNAAAQAESTLAWLRQLGSPRGSATFL